jgi:hypothetical protein
MLIILSTDRLFVDRLGHEPELGPGTDANARGEEAEGAEGDLVDLCAGRV